MKKIFTLIALASSVTLFGQSFSVYKTNNSQTTITATITNGYSLADVTSSSAQSKGTFKIVNNSASTTSLNIIRTIVYQAPTLILDGSTNTPYTYFCFGNTCFPSNVSTAGSSDYTILGAAGSTVAPFDNSKDNAQPFIVYFEEAPTTGNYYVRYKIFNVSNPNDSISFNYKYNEFPGIGINENVNTIESVSDVFPNPSNNAVNFSLQLKKESDVKVEVFNSLGSLVYTTTESRSVGKNKLSFDCSKYNSGLYFVTISAGESKITKRLVISK